ncbi:uncharacterized protein [Procambarus clarkii]|uniref:uncharacterized protein n=1 Tax=Procambarus clarkii TaxID=6728 RepID=UPI001E676F63|nr:uncharacterized protein LOC123757233 [Procambarus clarkii]
MARLLWQGEACVHISGRISSVYLLQVLFSSVYTSCRSLFFVMATARGRDGLEEMSQEDFLKEAVTAPMSEDQRWLRRPSRPYTSYSQRWRGNSRKRGDRGQDAWRSSSYQQARGGFTPSQGSRRDGMRPGVMIAHEPHPRRPLPLRSNPSARPFESILTLGSHEASTVKEGPGRQEEGKVILDMEAVANNAQPAHKVNFVLGQLLPVKAGRNYHFLPVQDLALLRRDTILKLLVGMLNTGERGVVYLGVQDGGRVEGVSCEPQILGQFVEGLMKSIQFYLMPRLHAPQYGVRYTNVLTSKDQILNNVWVVELHAVPKMQHYYNAVMDMDYHIRHNTHTETLPFPSFCSAIVATTSRPYQQETSKLEQKVKLLEKALQERGVDISSVGPHVCDNCWFADCPAQCYGRAPVVCGSRR